jgi:hypothetical protein
LTARRASLSGCTTASSWTPAGGGSTCNPPWWPAWVVGV